MEKEVLSRMNNNLSDKTYIYLNPESNEVNRLVKRAIDVCKQYFYRFDYKFVLVVNFFHQTVGTASFNLSNEVKKQHKGTKWKLRQKD